MDSKRRLVPIFAAGKRKRWTDIILLRAVTPPIFILFEKLQISMYSYIYPQYTRPCYRGEWSTD